MQISLWVAEFVLAIARAMWYNYFCGCVAITMHQNTKVIGVDIGGCAVYRGNFDGAGLI